MSVLKLLTPFLPRRLRRRLIRSAYTLDLGHVAGVQVKVAETREEHLAAARLVHDGYVSKGLMPSHGSGVRTTPFLGLPTTMVFVALREGEMVGTLSLVVDSTLGLPMERIYPDEVRAARSGGRRIAEVGAQCVRPQDRGTGVAFLLNKAMFLTAELLRVDDVLIAVHPDAEDFYGAMLCFERVGPVKTYPSLNRSALSVALRLRGPARETHREAFGGLPRTKTNPHHLYWELEHEQLRLPSHPSFVAEYAAAHLRATAKLAALRPDTLMQLDDAEFGRFRQALAGTG